MNLKCSQGVGFIGFIMVIGVVIAFMVAGVATGIRNSNKQAHNLRAATNALTIFQQLGEETVRARQEFLVVDRVGAPCPAGLTMTESYSPVTPNNAFCFPGDPLEICVPNPYLVDNPASAASYELICSTDSEPMFQIQDVVGGIASQNIENEFKSKNFAEVDYKPSPVLPHIKNIISYLTVRLKAQKVYDNFDFASAAAPAINVLANDCGAGTLCKRCYDYVGAQDPNELVCAQFRVCPKYNSCDVADDTAWVVQKMGVLHSPANP